ncbi:MAG: acyl carrier protein [Bacteroidales bacterium]|nr:acyl carrier protein [Bacteroidales bacterium]
MTREEIFAGLKEIFAAVKPKSDLSKVTMDSSLVMDLGIDSLSMLLMSLAIEKKFDFQFKTMQQFKTVSEIVDYISEQVNS